MKHSLLLVALLTVLVCGSALAQTAPDKAPKMDVTGTESIPAILHMIPAGSTVELHLRSGEKMGGVLSVAGDNVVRLTKLTGAEYYEAFINTPDISAVVVRSAPSKP